MSVAVCVFDISALFYQPSFSRRRSTTLCFVTRVMTITGSIRLTRMNNGTAASTGISVNLYVKNHSVSDSIRAAPAENVKAAEEAAAPFCSDQAPCRFYKTACFQDQALSRRFLRPVHSCEAQRLPLRGALRGRTALLCNHRRRFQDR